VSNQSAANRPQIALLTTYVHRHDTKRTDADCIGLRTGDRQAVGEPRGGRKYICTAQNRFRPPVTRPTSSYTSIDRSLSSAGNAIFPRGSVRRQSPSQPPVTPGSWMHGRLPSVIRQRTCAGPHVSLKCSRGCSCSRRRSKGGATSC